MIGSTYQFQVLTPQEAKLINDYTPWAYKVGLAELLDAALATGTSGILPTLVIPPPDPGDPAGYGSAFIGLNIYVANNAYISGGVFIGGGYGDTGCTIDDEGNIVTDGYIDCTVGGVRIREEVVTTSGTAGYKGDTCYGFDTGTWYYYVCVEHNTWARVALDTAF